MAALGQIAGANSAQIGLGIRSNPQCSKLNEFVSSDWKEQ